jgi:hypothetical protein
MGVPQDRGLDRTDEALIGQGIFRQVANAREGGWSTDIPRFHLGDYVSLADREFAAQIADAPAPFWRQVREALAERRP